MRCGYPAGCENGASHRRGLCLKRMIVGPESVPPAVAGGFHVGIQNQMESRMLITDPPATAGGTDSGPRTIRNF